MSVVPGSASVGNSSEGGQHRSSFIVLHCGIVKSRFRFFIHDRKYPGAADRPKVRVIVDYGARREGGTCLS